MTSTRQYHTSVLLQEILEYLGVAKGARYIDGTLGGGGHTGEIIKLGGTVLGIDQDEDSLIHVKESLKAHIASSKLYVAKGNFSDIGEIARRHNFIYVQGVLLDLGVSSHQLDDGTRGFSFMTEAPLDMRMDQEMSVTAMDLVNGMTKSELVRIFEMYGEERFARKIADQIIDSRSRTKIETTTQLASIIKRAYPRSLTEKIHPATRIFQALRIVVNDEMRSLERALPEAYEVLAPHGRLAVISFHSLEDRIVKQTFMGWERDGKGKSMTKKPIVATDEEIMKNNRSRSAKLRVFQKN